MMLMLVSKCSGGQLGNQQARLRYVAAAIAYTCIAVDAVLCSKYYKAVNVDGAGARLQAWQALTVVSRLCDVCAGAGAPVAVAAPAGSSRPPSRPHTCRAAGSGSTHSSSSGWPCRRRCIIRRRLDQRLFILSDAPSQRLRWAHTAVRAPCLQPFSILIMCQSKMGRVCQTTLLAQGCAQPLPLKGVYSRCHWSDCYRAFPSARLKDPCARPLAAGSPSTSGSASGAAAAASAATEEPKPAPKPKPAAAGPLSGILGIIQQADKKQQEAETESREQLVGGAGQGCGLRGG